MITETEKKLIHLLVDLSASDNLIHGICSGLTEEQMEFTRQFLLRVMKTREVEEQDILMARVYAKNREKIRK